METGLEFVANARRQMIRLIALTVLLSGSVLLLLIAILMIITGRIADLALYAGLVDVTNRAVRVIAPAVARAMAYR